MPLQHRLLLDHSAFTDSYSANGSRIASQAIVKATQLAPTNVRVSKVVITATSSTAAAIAAAGTGVSVVLNSGTSGTNSAVALVTTTFPISGSGNPVFSSLLSFSVIARADNVTSAEKISGITLDRATTFDISLTDSSNNVYRFPGSRLTTPGDTASLAYQIPRMPSGLTITKITVSFLEFSLRSNLTLLLASA